MIMKALRKNIGTIIAVLGFFFLCIITFGDLGEFMTDDYWANVGRNLTSIGFLAVALTLIQVSIKQGLAEQALQSGLNTENTAKKYLEHKELITKNQSRIIYLPYFLQIYNKRHTALKKREFLIDNNFSAEKMLIATGDKKMIKRYNNIKTMITAGRIKWATTDITYNKYGQIMTLQEHRVNRTWHGIMMSMIFMVGITLLTRGLFFDSSETTLWEKFIKLFAYIISIGITSILVIIKEYEKGAFGVPNDLDEINEIWNEFSKWEVPAWVKTEIEDNEKEVGDETNIDGRTDIQKEQKESEGILNTRSDNAILIVNTSNSILRTNDKELIGEHNGNTEPIR